MFTENIPFHIKNISDFFRKTLFEKLSHTYFSNKTKTLTIFPLGIRETGCSRFLSNLGFSEMPNGKKRI